MGIISWSLLANKYMLLGSAAKSWNLCNSVNAARLSAAPI